MNHDGNRQPIEIPTDPQERMGVYQRFEDVPAKHRLENYAAVYRDRDVWSEFEARQVDEDASESHRARIDRCGRRWKEHMMKRCRHHALARPEDVETYIKAVLEACAMRTIYSTYWTHLKQFFDWLLWHTEHPHRYHPVLMAAAHEPNTNRMWRYVIEDVR